jgi:hypothetical protein
VGSSFTEAVRGLCGELPALRASLIVNSLSVASAVLDALDGSCALDYHDIAHLSKELSRSLTFLRGALRLSIDTCCKRDRSHAMSCAFLCVVCKLDVPPCA